MPLVLTSFYGAAQWGPTSLPWAERPRSGHESGSIWSVGPKWWRSILTLYSQIMLLASFHGTLRALIACQQEFAGIGSSECPISEPGTVFLLHARPPGLHFSSYKLYTFDDVQIICAAECENRYLLLLIDQPRYCDGQAAHTSIYIYRLDTTIPPSK